MYIVIYHKLFTKVKLVYLNLNLNKGELNAENSG